MFIFIITSENEDDYDDDPLSFRLLTKQKSWRIRCSCIKEKQDWFNDIVKIARYVSVLRIFCYVDLKKL